MLIDLTHRCFIIKQSFMNCNGYFIWQVSNYLLCIISSSLTPQMACFPEYDFYNDLHKQWLCFLALYLHVLGMSFGCNALAQLTHHGCVTHICVGKLSHHSFSDNSSSPIWHQTFTWIGPSKPMLHLGTDFSEAWIKMKYFLYKMANWKIPYARCRSYASA